MIDIKLFKEKPLHEKLKISLFNLPPEKSFYSGSAFFLCGIFILISSLYFLSKLTVSVPKKDQQVSISHVGNFKYFLPIYSSSNIDHFVTGLLYSGLLKKESTNTYINDLAQQVISDETGTKITVKLKNDLFFSNGDKILTDDIIFSYELAANILADGNNRVKYEGISFEKIDDINFVINFAKSFSNINEVLSLGIISKNDYQNENFETLTSSEKGIYSITSGIYKIKTVEKDTDGIKKITLEINNNKYSIPHLKYININTYKNTEDFYKEIINGLDTDIIFDSNNLDENIFNEEKNFTKANHITPKMTVLFLNANKKEILAKKKVRESIYYSVNRSEIVSLSNPNNENIQSFDLLPATPLRSDLDEKAEIENFENINIDLQIIDNEKQNKIAESIKTSLNKIGININIIKNNQGEVINNIIKNRDFEMLLYSIEINNPEDLYAFWSSTQRNAPGLNITSYTSSSFDKNLNIIKTSSSSMEIEKSLESMKKEFYDEYPYIPLYTNTESMHIKNNTDIGIPKQIYNKKDLTIKVNSWSKENEKVWYIIKKYEKNITEIYKLIH